MVVCGYIAIAKVDNPNGVSHIDGHYYQALEGAGRVHATSIGHAVQNSHAAYTDENGKEIPKSLGWRVPDGNTTLVRVPLSPANTKAS